MMWAITRDVSLSFEHCQLTHIERARLDIGRARMQHDAYEWALVELGCTVRRIDASPEMPDSVFIEDTAVIFPEAAVIARPGTESRRVETAAVKDALRRFNMPMREIAEPGTLDGGDVLVMGRQVFVGLSTRTNATAVNQLRQFLRPLGYRLHPVPVEGCLHLKSAATAVGPDAVLLNAARVPADAFQDCERIEVHPDEPDAANALFINHAVIYPAVFPKTRARLEEKGLRVRVVDIDELAKAEGGVTCCSLVFET